MLASTSAPTAPTFVSLAAIVGVSNDDASTKAESVKKRGNVMDDSDNEHSDDEDDDVDDGFRRYDSKDFPETEVVGEGEEGSQDTEPVVDQVKWIQIGDRWALLLAESKGFKGRAERMSSSMALKRLQHNHHLLTLPRGEIPILKDYH